MWCLFCRYYTEPAHNKICTTSEDSNQPMHSHSLIKVFTDRICLLQAPGYPKRVEQDHLPNWVDVQADLSLCWPHRSYCRFFRALAHTDMGKDLLRHCGISWLSFT